MRYGKGEEIVCLVMKVMRKEFIMNELDNIKIDLSKNNPYHTTIIEELYKGEKYISYFKCGRCGKTFKSFIKNIVKYKYKVCYDCMKEIENEANIKYKNVCKIIEKYGYQLLSHNNDYTKIDIQDEYGYKGRTSLRLLKEGKPFSKFALYNPYSLDNLKLYCKINKLDCVVPNQKFKGYNKNIKVQCKCGAIFEISVYDFINSNQTKCKKCRQL